jgi:DNA-directed RNA polymerase subunit F
MPRNIVNVDEITIAEAKEFMEKSEGELSEFQRRAYEYAVKFAKMKGDSAKKLVEALVEKCSLSRKEAIQVVNCLPSTVEELRAILAVKGKMVTAEHLEDILSTIRETIREAEVSIQEK